MARLEKIYDVYFNGIKMGTGTKKGIDNSPKKNAVKVAIVNEKAMVEKYPGWKPYGGSKSKISDEITDRDRRKHETKEERRLRRNIRAQMAIENSRKDDSVFK